MKNDHFHNIYVGTDVNSSTAALKLESCENLNRSDRIINTEVTK